MKLSLAIEWILSVLINIPVLFFQWAVSRATHYCMMVSHDPRGGVKLCSYSEFKKDFERVAWRYEPQWPNSLFNEDRAQWNDNCIHADIFTIEGRGYLFTPFGLMLANRLVRKKIKEIKKEPGYRKFQWNY